MTRENPYFNLFDKSQTVSPLREKLGPVLHAVVEKLHAAYPQLSADHLTLLGGLAGVAGVLLTDKNKLLALSLLAGGVVADGLDGAMARHIASLDSSRPVKESGSLHNSVADFTREIAMNVTRTISASKRGDQKGELLAYMAMVTNPVARYFYWKSIAEGYDNPETGRNPIEFFGTHVGKPPCYITATAFPEIGSVPLQSILDALTTTGNLVSVGMNNSERFVPPQTLGPKEKRVGELRSRFHIFTSAATIAIAAGTYYALHRRDGGDSNTLR